VNHSRTYKTPKLLPTITQAPIIELLELTTFALHMAYTLPVLEVCCL